MRSLSSCVRWMRLLPAVFVIIGCEDRTPTRWERISAPKYSVALGSGTWTARAPMPTARCCLGVAAINGRLYAVGGEDAGSIGLATVEAYDPATNAWTTKTSMPTVRSGLSAAASNGILYALGGGPTSATLTTVQAYDPATDSWTGKAPMLTPRHSLGVTAINGALYAVGGATVGTLVPAPVEAYDPSTDTWTAKASMPTPRSHLGVAAVNGILYAVGGINYNTNSAELLATVEAYDPSTNTWTTKASLPAPRCCMGVAAIGGILYAVGGQPQVGIGGDLPVLATVDAYDPSTDTWTTLASMPTARSILGVAVINDILYAAGGIVSAGGGTQLLATVEAFEPTTPASVVVSPSGATIATAGGTQPFAAQFLDANGNPISGKTFTWASLNPNVATINSATGVATAVTSGQVTISATADGITGYSLLTISIPGGLPVTTWTPVASGTTQLLATVWGSSASDVFAVGNNGAIVHFNGTAWSAMTSGTSVALRGVWGSSASDVFVTGSSGTILHYNGSSWSPMTSGTSADLTGAVWGSSPSDVFAVGPLGTILRFDGANWTPMTSGTTQNLSSVWGTSSKNVYSGGTSGTILHFDGSVWSAMTSGTTDELHGLWGTGPGEIYAVGTGSAFVRYDGTTWNPIDHPATDALFAVWGSSPSDLYIAGFPQILRFNGSGWSATSTPTVRGLWGTRESHVYAVGDFADILAGGRAPANQPPTAVACVIPNVGIPPSGCAKSGATAGYIISPTEFPPGVLLKGDLSSDPDGDPLTYKWEEILPNGTVNLCPADPSRACPADLHNVVFAPGAVTHVVRLTVTDTKSASVTDQVMITVPDLVILVHGIFGSPASFGQMGVLLGQDFTVLPFDYSTSTSCLGSNVPIDDIAIQFGTFIASLQNRSQAHGVDYSQHIDVIAHSMGGLVVRAYMATPGSYPKGTFRRLVTAGTPSYGSSWAGLVTLCPGASVVQPDKQGADMVFGSLFLADLHNRWAGAQPIQSRDFLTIAGVLNLVEGDGIVKAYSATLPVELNTPVAYVPCAHSAVPGFSGSSSPGKCGLVDVGTTDHPTFNIVRQFLMGAPAPPPLPLNFSSGLLLLQFSDPANTRLKLDSLRVKFIFIKSGSVLSALIPSQVRCGGTAIPPLSLGFGFASDCPAMQDGGVASFENFAAGGYLLDNVKGAVSVSNQPPTKYSLPGPVPVQITGGRPIVRHVALVRAHTP